MKNPQFEVSPSQAQTLLDLANANRNDVFCDFGCGTGTAVREAVTYSKVKKAIGIEINYDMFHESKIQSIIKLSKIHQKKIDFWYGRFDSIELDDSNFIFDYKKHEVTILYDSLEEKEMDLNFYKERLNWKKVRFIKKDLPWVGYESVSNHEHTDCKFFLMKYPFKRIDNRDKWARSVLGIKNVTIHDVYDYYFTQLYLRMKKLRLRDKQSKSYAHHEAIREATEGVLNLEILVNNRFR